MLLKLILQISRLLCSIELEERCPQIHLPLDKRLESASSFGATSLKILISPKKKRLEMFDSTSKTYKASFLLLNFLSVLLKAVYSSLLGGLIVYYVLFSGMLVISDHFYKVMGQVVIIGSIFGSSYSLISFILK